MILTILIPAYNEKRTVKEIIGRVEEALLPTRWGKEIIIVDDNSKDGTSEEIKKLKGNNIKKLFHRKNLGKGAAIRTGLKEARGDVLLIQDADLEYDPQDYSRLLAPIIAGKTKVVYGSRLKTLELVFFGKNKTPLPLHYLANRFLSFLTNLLYGSKLTDMETCYKMMTKEIYQDLNLVSNRFEVEPEITAKILKKGEKIFEVPIETKPRDYQEGKKIKARDAFWAIATLVKFRFTS
ncbi:MAG: Undecaprenyl-phosphate 4-deoxy-4-formamido-L-arabinose transferase [Microgenomates group bacterium ADurb.Bin219]|nr:MAG: Undecaprenyl-phosphate 4-deoxy-4-formamido-L-arabinose transferase [Microgenomates group bacterium ADurb.Bin219]